MSSYSKKPAAYYSTKEATKIMNVIPSPSSKLLETAESTIMNSFPSTFPQNQRIAALVIARFWHRVGWRAKLYRTSSVLDFATRSSFESMSAYEHYAQTSFQILHLRARRAGFLSAAAFDHNTEELLALHKECEFPNAPFSAYLRPALTIANTVPLAQVQAQALPATPLATLQRAPGFELHNMGINYAMVRTFVAGRLFDADTAHFKAALTSAVKALQCLQGALECLFRSEKKVGVTATFLPLLRFVLQHLIDSCTVEPAIMTVLADQIRMEAEFCCKTTGEYVPLVEYADLMVYTCKQGRPMRSRSSRKLDCKNFIASYVLKTPYGELRATDASAAEADAVAKTFTINALVNGVPTPTPVCPAAATNTANVPPDSSFARRKAYASIVASRAKKSAAPPPAAHRPVLTVLTDMFASSLCLCINQSTHSAPHYISKRSTDPEHIILHYFLSLFPLEPYEIARMFVVGEDTKPVACAEAAEPPNSQSEARGDGAGKSNTLGGNSTSSNAQAGVSTPNPAGGGAKGGGSSAAQPVAVNNADIPPPHREKPIVWCCDDRPWIDQSDSDSGSDSESANVIWIVDQDEEMERIERENRRLRARAHARGEPYLCEEALGELVGDAKACPLKAWCQEP